MPTGSMFRFQRFVTVLSTTARGRVIDRTSSLRAEIRDYTAVSLIPFKFPSRFGDLCQTAIMLPPRDQKF